MPYGGDESHGEEYARTKKGVLEDQQAGQRGWSRARWEM